ncbi:MAG: hypothetical protein A2017_20195 [Lentisphaerae bacterium GWF2_44_16]|nr:MAG: hypothetical protein A2017_20195 [Lentisphaerae bacterium GWF2_44_16]
MKSKKKIYIAVFFCFVVLILFIAKGGCVAIAGKEITVNINPKFDPSNYKWTKLEKFSDGKIAPVDAKMADFFWRELNMPSPPQGTKDGIMNVSVFEEHGFCLPPGLSMHFKPLFFMTKRAEVIITDYKSKEKLLSIVYRRGLFASVGLWYGYGEAVLSGLRKVFPKAQTEAETTSSPPPPTTGNKH